MSWLALYIKELRLTKTKFLLNMVFLVMVGVLFYVLIERYNPFFIMLTVPLIILHLFYMFFAMLDSLRQEWKQNTAVFWMNIPKSGWQLLTAKYVAAMTHLFISLTLTFLIIYVLLYRSAPQFADPTIANFIIEQFQSFGWILFIAIFFASLQTGVVSTFIFMVAKSVRKWGWLLGTGIMVGGSWLWFRFQETAVYRVITEWGVVLKDETIMNSFFVQFDEVAGDPAIDMEMTNAIILYAGTAVVDLLLVVGVLYICAWLLDKKVEAS